MASEAHPADIRLHLEQFPPRIPGSQLPARWKLSYLTVSYNPPNVGANGTINPAVPLPAGTTRVGDIALLLGRPQGTSNGLIWQVRGGTCQTADAAPISILNITGGGIDDGALTLEFLIINIV